MDTLHKVQRITFFIVYRSFLGMRSVSDKFVEEIKTHVL